MAFNESVTKIKINYDASDAEVGLKRLHGSIKAIGSSAAAIAVIQFLKNARQESQEYKLAVNQLTAGLGYYSGALVKQAEILEKTKYIDAAELLQAQSRLAFYFKEESEIKKLTPAVIELARAKGMDLASAANLVALSFVRSQNAEKSDEGSLRALGIQYEKTGDRAKDLDALVKSLTDKFGGQSQAVMDSMDGWDKLAFTIKQVNEGIGKLFFGVSNNETKGKIYESWVKSLSETQNKLNKINETGKEQYKGQKQVLETNIAALKKQIDSVDGVKNAVIAKNKAEREAEEKKNKAELDAKRQKELERIEKERKDRFLKNLEWEVWEIKKAEDKKSQIRAGLKLTPKFKEETAASTLLMMDNMRTARERMNQLEEESITDESARINFKAQQEIDYWETRLGRTEQFLKLEKAIIENANIEKNNIEKKSWTDNTNEIIGRASSLSNSLQSLSDAQTNREIKNLDKKKMSRKRYDKEVERIEAEADERNKTFARAQQAIILGETIMNTAKAVMKSHATLPPPFNWIEAGLIAAAGGIQISAIQAQHFQRGYLGEVDRARRADSRPAMIGNNEAVIPAPQYAANEELVKAIVNGTANNRAMRGGGTVMNFYGLSSEQVIAIQRDSERRKNKGRLI